MVIWPQHKVSSDKMETVIEPGTPGHKVSGLSFPPWQLLLEFICKMIDSFRQLSDHAAY